MGTSTIGAGTAPRQAEMARVSQQPSELLVVLDRLAWGSMIAVVGFGAYRMCVALPATAHLPQRRYTIIQTNRNPVRERGLTPRSLVKRFASLALHMQLLISTPATRSSLQALCSLRAASILQGAGGKLQTLLAFCIPDDEISSCSCLTTSFAYLKHRARSAHLASDVASSRRATALYRGL